MKRVAGESNGGRSSKRAKIDYFSALAALKYQTEEINVTNLLNAAAGVKSGYIQGKVVTTWQHPKNLQFKFQSLSLAAGTKQVEVEFSGACAEGLKSAGKQFTGGQELRLSLVGAELVKNNGESTHTKLPIVLKYAHGVAFEVLAKGEEAGWTWPKPQPAVSPVHNTEPEVPSSGWFSTPGDPQPRVLATRKNGHMDIDEESSSFSKSPSPLQRPVRNPARTNTKQAASLPANSANHPIQNSFSDSISSKSLLRPSTSKIHPTNNANNSASSKQSSQWPSEHSVSSSHTSTSRAPSAQLNDVNTSATPKASNQPPRRRAASFSPPPRITDHDVASGVQPLNGVSFGSVSAPIPQPVAKKTRNQKRREKEKEMKRKEKEKANAAAGGVATLSASTLSGGLEASVKDQIPREIAAPTRTADLSLSTNPRGTYSGQPTPPPSPRESTAAALPHLPLGFTSLAEMVKAGDKRTVYSIIGVVSQVKEAFKTRNDWTRSLRIVDPVDCFESYHTANEGYSINFFAQTYPEWLPNAAVGNIIILCGLKMDNQGPIGYKDRLKWAVYDHSLRQIGHGDLAKAPREAGLAKDGFGAMFSPFYEHTDEELRYCVELGDWWAGVLAKRAEKKGTVHQIDGGSSVGPVKRPPRKHRLLCEVNTGDFFDCTVEVLHKYDNGDGEPYSIYVTDYTEFTGGYPYQQSWCPPSLVDRVFRIELCRDARDEGPTIVIGAIYRLRNVLMKMNRYSYVEGTMYEPKIDKLEDRRDNENLKALLSRKDQHGPIETNSAETDLNLKRIGDTVDKETFTCVVELLHIEESENTIFVTDYTSHPRLPAIDKPWAKGLDGRVLTVVLYDEQKSKTPNLVVGKNYVIQNLRLRSSYTTKGFQGTIGGSSTLIHPLSDRSSGPTGEWRELLNERRKAVRTGPAAGAAPAVEPVVVTPPAEAPVVTIPRKRERKCVSIKYLQSLADETGPFFVRARVQDFFPFNLLDSFMRLCTKCNEEIPEGHAACHACNDIEHHHVSIVSLLCVRICDGKDELMVSISGNVPLLEGQKRVWLREDPAAARDLPRRLQPLIGNLEEVHQNILRASEKVITPETAEMVLCLDRWKRVDGEWGYGLRDYDR